MRWTEEFARVERQREALQRELQALPEATLVKQPGPGRWAARQVIEHLILAERGSLNYLSYKLSQGEQPPPPGLRATLRSLLLNFLLWQPIKEIRAPELVSQPRNDRPTPEVLADWADQRQQLNAFLSAAPEAWHRALSYKHPLMGRLTLVAMLTFFGAHVGRHTRQIRRTIRAVSS
jgi:DinB superfamily